MGIRVQAAMDWLMERLFEGSDRPLPFLSRYTGAGPTDHGGGTVNMKRLFDACGLVVGVEHGRERALDGYAIEAREGHGGTESLTPSHAPLHLGAHGAIALHAHRTGDKELLDLALGWLRAEHGLLLPCMTSRKVEKERGGSRTIKDPWTAGARAVMDGTLLTGFNLSEGRAWFMAAVRGEKRIPKSQTFLGALCVQALPRDLREWIAERPETWPAVYGGLRIGSYPGGRFWVDFKTLPIREGGCRSAGFDGELWITRDNSPERILAYGNDTVTLIAPPVPET